MQYFTLRCGAKGEEHVLSCQTKLNYKYTYIHTLLILGPKCHRIACLLSVNVRKTPVQDIVILLLLHLYNFTNYLAPSCYKHG